MDILLPAIISCLITAITIPVIIPLSHKLGLIDDPNKRPHPAHIQKRVVPRAGGLAIFLGIVIPILLFMPLDQKILGIILGASVLLVIGLLLILQVIMLKC